ncbi:hypothetical protein Salat_2772400 [Sesamum alatum]|uniref:Uncharacterized protein n=1 Tax=Sesamum alatum TaxID=300844 RepID=A0AAE2C948_9LAMI|nr:hypothetical protein Salat_2772400 [Sesamum alatum]
MDEREILVGARAWGGGTSIGSKFVPLLSKPRWPSSQREPPHLKQTPVKEEELRKNEKEEVYLENVRANIGTVGRGSNKEELILPNQRSWVDFPQSGYVCGIYITKPRGLRPSGGKTHRTTLKSSRRGFMVEVLHQDQTKQRMFLRALGTS